MDTKTKIKYAILLTNGIGLIFCGASYLYKMGYIHGEIDGAASYCKHLIEIFKNTPSSNENKETASEKTE